MLLPRSHAILRSISRGPGLSRPLRPPVSLLLPSARVHVRPLSALPSSPSIHHRPSVFLNVTCSTTFQRNLYRGFSVTRVIRQDNPPDRKGEIASNKSLDVEQDPNLEYRRTDKAEAAKSVDLSARLKDRNAPGEKGEVLRLLKLAAREWRSLSCTYHPLLRFQNSSVHSYITYGFF
jgi:hypothetical protein